MLAGYAVRMNRYARPYIARMRSISFVLAMSPAAVWVAFVLAHLWLGLLNLYAPGLPLGDVTIVYKFWTDQALLANFWVGIDSSWVYPILALAPMLIARAFGPEQLAGAWLSMVMLLNVVAFGFITGWGRSRERIAVGWWWVAFLLLLGPIALGRIDSVSVPLAMVGVILIAARPRAAAIVLTVAMWIKVWPAALIVAAVVALKSRLRIVITVAVTSAAVIAVALGLGSGANVFSFITQQTGRGLQPESPVSTIFMWQAMLGVPGAHVYYDNQILSFGVRGPGDIIAIELMTPLLAVVVLVVALLGVRAARAGATPGELFPPLALALTTAMIAFNKVGSPQFIAWLAVPIVLGLAAHAAGHGRSFRIPAILGLVVAALTQLIYPYFYSELLDLNPLLVSALAVRNLLEFVILGWAIVAVRRSPQASSDLEAYESQWLPSVWPLHPDRDSVSAVPSVSAAPQSKE